VKIVLAGIIGRYPFGGVTWCSLMYLLGLRELGHDVLYIEDTGECVYDPVQNTRSLDPSYGTSLICSALARFGLDDRWAFVNYDGTYHGRSAEQVHIDSDPGFTQLAIAKEVAWYVDFFRGFDRLFTFGANIGTRASPVPTGPFTWEHTWQPVTLEHWETATQPRDRFTTVMTWQIESFTDVGGNKDQEFLRFLDLPAQTEQPFELAVNGPSTLLREHGWHPVNAMAVSRTPWEYRDFIHASRAEFGVAKHTYVATRSGWFSDRTECYLASGRPALVQDTGWTEHLPHGEGLLAFSTADQALDGIERINAGYERHARIAREIAHEHFDARRVLPRLIERACA
jgi:hypothetical protein